MYVQLRKDLLELTNKEIYSKYLLGQKIWFFYSDQKIKDPAKKYDDLKHYISRRLDIHFNNIAIVGSAKTGISFSPKKKFKMFNLESDIDIILVSRVHYLKFWKAYLNMFYNQKVIPEYEFVTKCIFKGFISLKNPTAKHRDIKEWTILVNDFVKDLQLIFGIERDINYRIYESWEDVEAYHFFGINQLRNSVSNNKEKEQALISIIKNLQKHHVNHK